MENQFYALVGGGILVILSVLGFFVARFINQNTQVLKSITKTLYKHDHILQNIVALHKKYHPEDKDFLAVFNDSFIEESA
jgi:hypothetical protein